MPRTDGHDVVILGGGLAGLTLARHLLRETDRRILLLERRRSLPSPHQKVGESSVQLAGHYLSKVLDLEEHLLCNHFMKYNLRFYWKTAGRANDRFEDYCQSYIRPFSNIPSYQLDRNVLEAHLLASNRADPRFTCELGVSALDVELSAGDRHRVGYRRGGEARAVRADWVVDTTGRSKLLTRRLGMTRSNPIRHGAFFWWVEGLVDIDKLTDASPREIRLKRDRRHQGHLPLWLATNHFCDEGLWFWVIPLQGKTSLGLVYDRGVVDRDDVFSVARATDWVCRRFPLFARDLPHRKVLDFGGLPDFSHDCVQTIHPDRWAVAGEAGRFTDPLYSPGSDLISIYNTLIVDAIRTPAGDGLAAKCRAYEQLMRAVYGAYVPSYATSYDALGDQEAFSLKYTWELSVYFAFYVFPFVNELLTERRFLVGYLRRFAELGPLNAGVQRLLSGYFQWKKRHRGAPARPVFFDFTELEPLRVAESSFYEIGVSVDEARAVLARQAASLEELARFIAAHVAAAVAGSPESITNRRFVEGLDPAGLRFDPELFRRQVERAAGCRETYRWRLDPFVLERFAPGDAEGASRVLQLARARP